MKTYYSKSAWRANTAVVILQGKSGKIGTFSMQDLPFLISKNTCLNFHSPFHARKEHSNRINADRKDERLVVPHLEDLHTAKVLESGIFFWVQIWQSKRKH